MKMNWEKSILFTLLLGAMILSCKQDGTIDAKSSVQQFFDLKGYFKAEAQRLKAKGRVTKFVTADGKTEERVIDSVDFQRELDFFAGSDINRPAWSDKYVVDTLFNKQQEVIQLSYECNDEHLKIRKIVVGV